MFRFGLSGWKHHAAVVGGDKLSEYAVHFPIVESESSFYAVQPRRNYEKWVRETPPDFGFVIKAYQGMTGHLRGNNPFENASAMFDAFLGSLVPVIEANRLKMVLFQYPPWFECNRRNVDALRYTKEKMGRLPVALEFRHQSWFLPGMRDKTLQFMEREGWIHSICDEPQAGSGSVPTVLHATHPELTLVRFHGRNASGWSGQGKEDESWRDVRYLYRYSTEELLEWKERLLELQKSTQEICVIFNNNSGKDAAPNAKELMRLLGVEYRGEAPGQINLFE
ncbi:uncharacterized protein YecE (DUF72 family) [Tumebacillus sp. BK434]|uniref:DUF72 domain-containing protein n=1 Tax=Tumebacillus sp. BK434 TaxID=2512169 RepID=UPI0010D98C8F|nr:DUF72 domain-containing protein [Tumebacillus sp. BK434]TCP58162.1 uncharacterized protein YecE (DUF72 family) [Tumebacillus sp. BK434]